MGTFRIQKIRILNLCLERIQETTSLEMADQTISRPCGSGLLAIFQSNQLLPGTAVNAESKDMRSVF